MMDVALRAEVARWRGTALKRSTRQEQRALPPGNLSATLELGRRGSLPMTPADGVFEVRKRPQAAIPAICRFQVARTRRLAGNLGALQICER